MAKSKATHIGECQVCGSFQKLPGGLMAKHGYTTRFNFFEGTCHGSDHLPYELSCDRIQAAADHAKTQAGKLTAEAKKWRGADTGNTAWVQHTPKPSFALKNPQSHWIQAELSQEDVRGQRHTKYTHGPDVRTVPHNNTVSIDYSHPKKSLPDIVKEQNNKYADHLSGVAKQHSDYLGYAAQRIKDWKPKPLRPITK